MNVLERADYVERGVDEEERYDEVVPWGTSFFLIERQSCGCGWGRRIEVEEVGLEEVKC